MHRRTALALAALWPLAVLFGRGGVARAQELRRIRLASLYWPPYTGPDLEGQGITATILRRAMFAAGLEPILSFLPWQRALHLARQGEVDGVFPEYHSFERAMDFLFTGPVGYSDLGFAERVDAPVRWSDLSDLTGTAIGVVAGYVNAEPFDAMAARGELSVDAAPDDALNLLKLLHGRVRLAVVDRYVFAHLMRHDPRLAPQREKLRFNDRLLRVNPLYVCLRRRPGAERMVAAINAGLATLSVRREQEALFATQAALPAPSVFSLRATD
jgi:polar amino acid transport system substrate-binding protein